MYNGDFSNWVDSNGKQIPIYDPTTQVTNADGTVTRQQFPGNKIPTSLFNPTAIQALKRVPGERRANARTTARRRAPSAYVTNNYIGHQRLAGAACKQVAASRATTCSTKSIASPATTATIAKRRLPGAEGPATLPGLYTNYNDTAQASDVVRFSWDWTLSPTKLNHFYAGGNNWRQDHNPPQEYIGNWKSKFCLGNVPDCDENLVNLFATSAAAIRLRLGRPRQQRLREYGLRYNDDFTWIKGNHTFKFGGQYQMNHYNGFGRQCEAGCVGFSFKETGVPGGTNSNAGGNAFASFLLGSGGWRLHRHGPVHRPAVAVFRWLLPG